MALGRGDPYEEVLFRALVVLVSLLDMLEVRRFLPGPTVSGFGAQNVQNHGFGEGVIRMRKSR